MSDASSPSPEKLYFKIGEVATLTGVKPYVLRYWESEFRLVRPSKSRSGQRLYQRRDIEVLLEIKRLLYEERYTIPGAKKQLRSARPAGDRQISLTFGGDRVDDVPHESLLADTAALPAELDPTAAGGALPSNAGAPRWDDNPSARAVLPRLALEDPTSTALVDQALREAQAILVLVARDGVVR